MESGQQHKAEIGNTIVMSKDFLAAYTSRVAEVASREAIEQYRIERSKDETLSVSEVAKLRKCSPPTVISWINNGIKKGKIKLKAYKKGSRDYVIRRYDLDIFLEQQVCA